jgi:3-oxoacyl-[acyl-carrier protein] reductase
MKKNILIIGGTSDIGKIIAKTFDKNQVHSVGSQELNLNNLDSINNFFMDNSQLYEKLIFVSGVNNPSLIENTSHEDFEKTLSINCGSLHYIFSKKFKCFSKLKSVVVIGSLYASLARSGRASYSISKHALLALVKSLAIEMSPECNVNMVSPGFIDTKLTKKNNSLSKLKKITSMIPQKTLGKPEDIANAVFFFNK